MRWFSAAILARVVLACGTIAARCCCTDSNWLPMTVLMLLKRCAMASAEVMICWRSGVEVGSTAAALRAAKKPSMPLLMLEASSPITRSSWVR